MRKKTEFLKTKNVINETKLNLIKLMPLIHCKKRINRIEDIAVGTI